MLHFKSPFFHRLYPTGGGWPPPLLTGSIGVICLQCWDLANFNLEHSCMDNIS